MKKLISALIVFSGLIYFSLVHPFSSQASALFQDNFSDFNGVLLPVHNSTWVKTQPIWGPSGAPDGFIYNNSLRLNHNSQTFYYVNTSLSQGDQCAEVDFNQNDVLSGALYIALRWRPTQTYAVELDPSQWKMEKIISGQNDNGWTILTTASYDRSLINHLQFCTIGSQLSFYVNGTLAGQANDSDISSGTAGIFSTDEFVLNNFLYDDGTAPTPTPTPTSTPTPTPVLHVAFQDSFTDTDDVSLQNHNPIWVKAVTIWESSLGSNGFIKNNALTVNHNSQTFYYINTATNETDQCSETDFNQNNVLSGAFYLVTRWTPTQTYAVELDPSQWKLEKIISGVNNNNWTVLATLPYDRSSINHIKLCALGNQLTLYLNGSLISGANDSSIQSGTAGFFSTDEFILDNFTYSITNYPPVINLLSDATINEGGTFAQSGSFIDPDSTNWSGIVNYGDGTGNQPLSLNSDKTFNLSHQYVNIGTFTITVLVTDDGEQTGTNIATVIVQRQLVNVSSAKIWVGLKTSDDVGVKFDLKAEVYKDSNLITSGELDSVAAGSIGFANAKLDTILFGTFTPIDFPSGSQLKLALYVRNACSGSGHSSGIARLWYNDNQANSQFGTTIGANTNIYYLLDNFLLGTTTGTMKKTIDIQSGAKCSAFKSFGTWTITP